MLNVGEISPRMHLCLRTFITQILRVPLASLRSFVAVKQDCGSEEEGLRTSCVGWSRWWMCCVLWFYCTFVADESLMRLVLLSSLPVLPLCLWEWCAAPSRVLGTRSLWRRDTTSRQDHSLMEGVAAAAAPPIPPTSAPSNTPTVGLKGIKGFAAVRLWADCWYIMI